MSNSRACSRYLSYLMVGLGCALVVWACGDDTPPDAGMPADAGQPEGRLSLAWEISDGTDPLVCDEVNAEVVRIQALPVGGGSAIIETFPCDLGVGSFALREDLYDVEVGLATALDSIGEPFIEENVNVVLGQTVSLGTVTLVVSPRGNVELFLDAPGAGGNCEAAPDGAGITQMALELRNDAGACVPATFEIEAGATQPAGSYVTDCAGARFACIENDQRVRVSGVRAGQYTLAISALQGETVCYERNSQFKVPGGDLTANLESLALISTGSCDPGAVADAGVDAAGL